MKTTRTLFVFAVATLFLLVACGGGAPAEPVPAPEQPPTAEPPAAEPAPLEPTQPAEPAPLEPTLPQYAPFCEAAPAGCAAPTVEMLDNSYCVEKVPYAIMSVPAGTTYESFDSDMACVDQLHSDGNLRVTCHSVTGKQLWSYDLKICNGACSAPALQMETGQCPDGYGFDVSNQCCAAPPPASGDGCITYKVDIGGCHD